ncbi:helix-turn-helix transcriptional regulator [Cellulomonas rhizosphaerae]|uniref:WYL domain-containing protein n=1 Tax=Cellulomonas rhizosphaerae TaxID=2293719 RepID=A0A413RLC1_9CELL|nr:WYL domain-containing protein [Cellulomonas rhizosphaerae]RHA40697.1 WYL domain-containing protein [Cellulomonas rhizosphaerae]
MADRASDRLLRMLGMIAYLDRHEGVPVGAIAEHFGVSAAQVMQDVELLWVTGTPGYLPYDLIDFDASAYDQGVVRLTEGRGMTRPLRLGAREAVSLVAALRALDGALGPALDAERAAVLRSALAKLTAATGDAATAVDVALAASGTPGVTSAIATALRERRRLHIRYVNASDVATERDVDPIRLVTDDERSYLLGWCRAVDGERLFRVDRVLDAVVLDEAAEQHDVAPGADTFAPSASADLVTLHLASRARWVAEVTPVEAVRNREDGSFEVDVRVVNRDWLQHLLLQVADSVVSISPPSVGADAAAAARSALDAYERLALR